MWKSRTLTLGCCLAALPLLGCTVGAGPQGQAHAPPIAGIAWSPDRGGARIYANEPGGPAAILVLLPAPGDVPGDPLTRDPRLWAARGFDVVMPPPDLYRLAADHETAFERLIASARAMADAPIWLVGPNPAIAAAMAQAPMSEPGRISGVVVTSVASNAGTCSERMVYADAGTGAAPTVRISRSGSACPAGSPFGAASNPAAKPAAPAVRPKAPRLIEASAGERASPHARRSIAQHVAELIKPRRRADAPPTGLATGLASRVDEPRHPVAFRSTGRRRDQYGA